MSDTNTLAVNVIAPRSGMVLSFSDEFNGTKLPDVDHSTWSTVFPGNFRWLAPNYEKQIYLDQDFRTSTGGTVNINPFSMGDGTLTISANPTPANMLSAVYNQPYTSGMINTANSENFRYGYIEINAQMPKGQGLWPALWLRSADSSVQSEIDIVELLGQKTTFLYQTTHADDGTTQKTTRATVTDLSVGYHKYGVDWQQDRISFYLDGQLMGSAVTPESLKVPMYLIANLAVGGSWAGNPDGTNVWPAEMKIDYIHVWQDQSSFAGQSLTGTVNADLLSGGDGNDSIVGGGGNDRILGADGNDLLNGGLGNDRIVGGFGNDTLIGSGGSDTLIGGYGNDTYVVNDTLSTIVDVANGGIDTIVTTMATYSLGGTMENLIHTGDTNFRGTGNAWNNIITGGGGADTLIGGAGNDTLEGKAGNDSIDGGIGDDIIYAGSGNNTVNGADGHDVFGIHAGDTGTTTINSFSIAQDRIDVSELGIKTYADAMAGLSGNKLVFGGETLIFQNATPANLTAANFIFAGSTTSVSLPPVDSTVPVGVIGGTSGNDVLKGTTGNDTIDGGAGADTMGGGAGNDTYLVDNVGDVVNELSNSGFDTVRTALSSYSLGGSVEALEFTGSVAFRGVGNVLANQMSSTGTGSAELIGGAGNDTLVGGVGNDKLSGGNDSDVLTGGAGNDTLMGGDASDLFLFKATDSGRDVITDFVAGTDHLDMRGLGANDFNFITSHAVDNGTSTVITIGTEVLTLQNVHLSVLSASDFVF